MRGVDDSIIGVGKFLEMLFPVCLMVANVALQNYE